MMNHAVRFHRRPLASSPGSIVRSPLAAALGSLMACALLGACSSAEDDASGPPAFGAAPPATSPGNVTPGAANPTVNPTPSNPGSPPTASTGSGSEPVSGNGTPISNGSGGTGSGGSANAGVAGGVSSGGSAPVDPGMGAAGSSMGIAGSTSMAGAGGSSAQPEPPTPAGPDIECPAGASFCSGFEGSAFPEGTQSHSVGPGLPNPFVFDTTEAFAGSQSLSVPATGSGGFFYRALAVPVPGQDFWVRLYMHLSTPLGDNSHDSVFGASSGGLAADVNGEALVELSEQFNEVLLNTDDAVFNPAANSTLPANQWLCMEAHYNGGSGDVQIFADGDELINAPGYRPLTYQTFRIGYMRYNDDRTVRYDNVVVAPNRVGCD